MVRLDRLTNLHSVIQPGQLLIGVAGVLLPQPGLLQSWNPKQLLHHSLNLLHRVRLAELRLLLLLQVGIFCQQELHQVHFDLEQKHED